MSRRTKMTVAATGLGVVAAGAVAVPALAATGSDSTSVGATRSPSATSTQPSESGSADADGPRGGFGLRLFGASAADVAKAAGATEAQLQQGLRDGKSLAEIASAHQVSKATLVSRLGALVDEQAGTIVDGKRGAGAPGRDAAGAPRAGARKNPLSDVLAGLVKKGTITQAQADAITQAMEAKRGAMGDPLGRVHRGGGPFGADVKELASVLKLSETQLRTQMQSGKSLADIAAAQGVSRDTVVQKVASLLKADLSTLVDQKMPVRGQGHGPSDLPNLPQRQGDSSSDGTSAGGAAAPI